MTRMAVRWLSGLAVRTAAFVSVLTAQPLNRLPAQDPIPVGYGTLRRDDITVRFASPTVEIQVLPLDDQVIRLLAPDTYRSIAQLIRSRAADLTDAAARGGAQNPTLMMVT